MKKKLLYCFITLIALFLLFLFCTYNEYSRFKNHLKDYSSQKPIHLVFAGDNAYITPLLTAFTSISLNTKTPVKIHLLTNGFSDKNIQKLTKLDEKLKNIEIELIIVSDQIFENFPINSQWSQTIYYRYLIPILLPELDKALYLDGDILVFDDLSQLYHTNLNDNMLAAIQDGFEEYFLERPIFKDLTAYINSGVLLINLTAWRDNDIPTVLFKKTKEYQDQLTHYDQDIINLVFNKKILLLEKKYNAQQRLTTPINKVIYHYTGKKKPWKAWDLSYYEWYKYFEYTKNIFREDGFPLKAYLTYLFKKVLYYLFIV